MRLRDLLLLALLIGVTYAQDDAAAGDDNDGDGAEDGDGGGEEECEEAWDYIEFLKKNMKEKIESIIQDTLFQNRPLLEQTVADAMSEVLTIRDDLLERTKKIRTGSDEIKICPEQGIKQEEYLTERRMDVMAILLKLIEPDAATPEKLQEVGRQLLALRTTINGKITELIMLRESRGPAIQTGDCDCGILVEVLEGLDEVVGKPEDKKEGEEGDDAEGDDAAAGDEGEEGGDDMGGMDPVQGLTMVLMTVDARIGTLYNEIIAQLEEGKKAKLFMELSDLKDISSAINEVLSDLTGETNEAKIERLIKRDVVRVRNDVDRLLQQCRQNCPTECDSCGADKIDEVLNKLQDYNISLLTLDEEDAKESVRADLMTFLARTNEEMTKLLTSKVESGAAVLEGCDKETLEVINSIKGPLWMLVNITIFGDGATMNDMIIALETALIEMRGKYCAQESTPTTPDLEENQCDLDEINTAGIWISEIDTIISENLFKTDDKAEEGRTGAMLGFVELKSAMDDRVRQLFQDNLVCKEEVEQIKNIYVDHVTKCLAEMMNPKYRFEEKSRAERVQCIKTLRVTIEDRRGELLLREIEKRIRENTVGGDGGEAA